MKMLLPLIGLIVPAFTTEPSNIACSPVVLVSLEGCARDFGLESSDWKAMIENLAGPSRDKFCTPRLCLNLYILSMNSDNDCTAMTPNGVALSPMQQLRSICDTTAGTDSSTTNVPTNKVNSTANEQMCPFCGLTDRNNMTKSNVQTNTEKTTVSPMLSIIAPRYDLIRELINEANIDIDQLYDFDGLEEIQSLLPPRNTSATESNPRLMLFLAVLMHFALRY
jgi:hypothetical protein